jgi:hypothetical protein
MAISLSADKLFGLLPNVVDRPCGIHIGAARFRGFTYLLTRCHNSHRTLPQSHGPYILLADFFIALPFVIHANREVVFEKNSRFDVGIISTLTVSLQTFGFQRAGLVADNSIATASRHLPLLPLVFCAYHPLRIFFAGSAFLQYFLQCNKMPKVFASSKQKFLISISMYCMCSRHRSFSGDGFFSTIGSCTLFTLHLQPIHLGPMTASPRS